MSRREKLNLRDVWIWQILLQKSVDGFCEE